MSSYLYRLGHAVAGRARRVLALWLLLLVALGGAAALSGGQLQDDLTIPGVEAQEGLDVLARRFPEVSGTSAQVLVVAPEGAQVAAHRADVTRLLERVRDVDHVLVATDPFDPENALSLSRNGRDALIQVQLDQRLDEVEPATVTDLEEAVEGAVEGTGLDVHLGGQLFAKKSVQVSATEGIGVLVALVVLAVTFWSLLAAGMPILTAILGVGVAMSGLFLAAALTSINTSTPTLALMIGLAVGIDYALFIVSRHRAQLARGMEPAESIAQSSATAGSAVIFAGATVIIALCGLVVAQIPFLAVMGYAAAAAVAVAVAVALTVVPALLAVAGERLRPRPGSRAARNATAEPASATTLGARWVRMVTRVPALTALVVVALLVLMTLPARDLALGLPDNGSAEEGSGPRETYDLITEDYGPGFNTPLLVTVDIIKSFSPVEDMDALGADLAELEGVRAVALATPNRTADLGIVQIIPEHAQTDPRTAELVREIRERRETLEERYDFTDLRVTGQTAVAIDVSDRLFGALLPFGLVVVGLSLLLLMVVFRSIAVPVKATVGYLLSVGASFGAVTAVFGWGWFAETLNVPQVGPVISFLPILLMGVLFGLAMDYEVFLVSRMREDYVHGADARTAVRTGFTGSARVVTAAAVIMISVFAAFVPHGDSTVQPIAFGLAVGVFVDAFLVRMTLVPAVLAMLGDRAWWLPASLERRLPVLDVEGEGIAKHVEHDEWNHAHGRAAVRAEGVGLTADGEQLLAGVDVLLRAGEVLAVQALDPVRRRALLAMLTGRLGHDEGRLVVLDRVLPAEAPSVRRKVALHTRFPDADRLARVADGVERGRVELVVLDNVDGGYPDDDATARRWAALQELAAAGTAVVAGCTAAPPHGVAVLELPGRPATAGPRVDPATTSETPAEEATV